MIPFRSPEYPEALRELSDAPKILWVLGDRAALHDPVVAIVGTRRATSYGLRIAHEVAGALARAGACVVSGMALGIDAAAHRGALDAGGKTVAVLGTGVDRPHPRANLAIYRQIVETGMVLSEMPPGARPHRGSFPNRNRIIAGLAKVVIIIEAPVKSGAMITYEHAQRYGREIAVVPGPIDSPQSAASNLLMRDGAHVIASPDDAVTLVGLSPKPIARPRVDDETEMRIWAALEAGVASLDELCARASLPVSQCLTAVTGLELRGAIECALTGEIRRR